MQIPRSIKVQACKRLLHYYPVKTLAKELNISHSSVQNWVYFINRGYFDWIDRPWAHRQALLDQAVEYWFDNYPIGYADGGKLFGVRASTIFSSIRRRLAKLPENLRPKLIRFWDAVPAKSLGTSRMAITKLSDMPADRPLTTAERKALFEELEDARCRLAVSESMLEVAIESCTDELKKRIKAAIKTCEKGFSVVRVCRAVGIPRSTFYASQKQTEAQQREAKLAQTVEGIQIKHYFTIGRRRTGKLVAEELGFEPCECTLQRVMKGYGLNAQIRRVRKVKPHAGKAYQAQLPDNTLNREFRAEQPLHRMVTDVTYIPYYANNE